MSQTHDLIVFTNSTLFSFPKVFHYSTKSKILTKRPIHMFVLEDFTEKFPHMPVLNFLKVYLNAVGG